MIGAAGPLYAVQNAFVAWSENEALLMVCQINSILSAHLLDCRQVPGK